MNKHIILFGAGRSATCLIDYLLNECMINGWQLTVADSDLLVARSKIGSSSHASAKQIPVQNETERAALIKTGDLIISLLPASLHFLVAKTCVEFNRSLLTASYLDDQLQSFADEIKSKGLLFLCEMGLDPGIDHMSAMRVIDSIRNQGGKITSFKSHCGGLVAPQSDNNPWHYKVSWNPRNIVMAGSAGAIFKQDGLVVSKSYENVFVDPAEIFIDGIGTLACYPNRDSLNYVPLYQLNEAATFIRTTLRFPSFCSGWNAIVRAGLTNDSNVVDERPLSFQEWAEPVLPYVNEGNEVQFSFLGLFDNRQVPVHLRTSADILQYLVEEKLSMQPGDQDMIVMVHELEYEIPGKKMRVESSLVAIGEDHLRTAMAKTVGLPLGIAAKLILQEKLNLTGLHIPVAKEIYEPVLNELSAHGIRFNEIHRETEST